MEPEIQLVQISNDYPQDNLSDTSVMRIGVSDKKNIYRVLLKMSLNEIPQNATIVSTNLILNMTSIKHSEPNIITPYVLTDNWSVYTVSWEEQPSFDPENYGESVDIRKSSKYSFDITNIIKQWYENNLDNYGLILKNAEIKKGALAKISTNLNSCYKPIVEIVYEVDCECVVNSTTFTDQTETLESHHCYTYSELFNTSLATTDIFFVQNLGKHKVTAHLQVSPDGINFLDEPAEISLSSMEINFLVPCIFAKYTRVAVKTCNNKKSMVKIWYQSQE